MQSHITYPTLRYHHSLRPTKAPKCGVGRQIGFTHVASATNVRDVIAVVHMKECSLQDLKKNNKKGCYARSQAKKSI